MTAFNVRLVQSVQLRQEMKINPRLYQAMELLYMPILDLKQHLKQEMAQNPFLELAEEEEQEEVELDEEGPDDSGEEIDWEGILLDGFDAGGRREQYEHREYYEPTPVDTHGLQDYLTEQLRLLSLSEREEWMGEEIIGNVDDDGLLGCELEDMLPGADGWLMEAKAFAVGRAEEMDDEEERTEAFAEIEEVFRPYVMAEAEEMLLRIQEFDPSGVGARNLRETILLQLGRKDQEDALAYHIVEGHWEDFIDHRWTDIAKEMGITPLAVQDAADEIAKLDPKPGLRHSADPERYIIPDLIVEKIEGEYMVFANDTSIPRLRISRSYREVVRDKGRFTKESKEFISSKLNSATWMIQAIEQRRQTMLKVMSYIVDRQRDFFERGVQHLKPLTLREVADHIDMHESTVSRVTNEKWAQTPRGVFPLKYFFSSGLSTASGEDISARGVRDKIQNLVGGENQKKPLTDQAIVDLLKAEGVNIARRTVAKYRDQLGILPARMRKRV